MRKFTEEQKRNGEMAVRLMREKAQWFYNNTEPYGVREVDNGYWKEYWEVGCYGENGPYTFEELESYLEERCDEYFAQELGDWFWNDEIWGSSFPPINSDEVINAANEIIEYKTVNELRDPELVSDELWEEFCTTGKVGNIVAIYEEEE